MEYSIKEVSQMMNLPATTIRYYDKEGLLPFIKRKNSGYRVFSEDDISLLKIIECLKNTGLSIKKIRDFVECIKDGDNSLKERYQLFNDRKKVVEEQIEELKKMLELIDYKCWYYKTALEAGTEKIHSKDKKNDKFPCEE